MEKNILLKADQIIRITSAPLLGGINTVNYIRFSLAIWKNKLKGNYPKRSSGSQVTSLGNMIHNVKHTSCVKTKGVMDR